MRSASRSTTTSTKIFFSQWSRRPPTTRRTRRQFRFLPANEQRNALRLHISGSEVPFRIHPESKIGSADSPCTTEYTRDTHFHCWAGETGYILQPTRRFPRLPRRGPKVFQSVKIATPE